MKTLYWMSGAAMCLALGACGDEPASQDAPAPGAAAGTENSAPAAGTETGSDSEETITTADAPEAAVGTVTSAYTKYNLDDCEVLRAEEVEGESLETKCAGYNGVPLYVNVGDGRFDIDAGVTNGFATISPFNDLNDTIEWRLNDGKPFAVIARLKDVSMESGGNSALMVETVGSAGKPGCRVAHVWNSRSDQNAVARQIADRTLDSEFTCPAEPRRVD